MYMYQYVHLYMCLHAVYVPLSVFRCAWTSVSVCKQVPSQMCVFSSSV